MALTPVGSIILYPCAFLSANMLEMETKHWMLCDGRSLRATTYIDLYNAIGYAFGGRDGYFDLPDYRSLAIQAPTGQPNAPLAYYMIKFK